MGPLGPVCSETIGSLKIVHKSIIILLLIPVISFSENSKKELPNSFLVRLPGLEIGDPKDDRKINITLEDDGSIGDLTVTTNKKFCEQCKKEGKKSMIFIGGTSCTAVFCGLGYWNEEGEFQPRKDCNTCSTTLSCSNGHVWEEELK